MQSALQNTSFLAAGTSQVPRKFGGDKAKKVKTPLEQAMGHNKKHEFTFVFENQKARRVNAAYIVNFIVQTAKKAENVVALVKSWGNVVTFEASRGGFPTIVQFFGPERVINSYLNGLTVTSYYPINGALDAMVANKARLTPGISFETLKTFVPGDGGFQYLLDLAIESNKQSKALQAQFRPGVLSLTEEVLWYTMSDKDVRKALKKDSSDSTRSLADAYNSILGAGSKTEKGYPKYLNVDGFASLRRKKIQSSKKALNGNKYYIITREGLIVSYFPKARKDDKVAPNGIDDIRAALRELAEAGAISITPAQVEERVNDYNARRQQIQSLQTAAAAPGFAQPVIVGQVAPSGNFFAPGGFAQPTGPAALPQFTQQQFGSALPAVAPQQFAPAPQQFASVAPAPQQFAPAPPQQFAPAAPSPSQFAPAPQQFAPAPPQQFTAPVSPSQLQVNPFAQGGIGSATGAPAVFNSNVGAAVPI